MRARRCTRALALVAFVNGCTAPLILAEPSDDGDDGTMNFAEPPRAADGASTGSFFVDGSGGEKDADDDRSDADDHPSDGGNILHVEGGHHHDGSGD